MLFLSGVCMEMVKGRTVERILKGQRPGWDPKQGWKSCTLKVHCLLEPEASFGCTEPEKTTRRKPENFFIHLMVIKPL